MNATTDTENPTLGRVREVLEGLDFEQVATRDDTLCLEVSRETLHDVLQRGDSTDCD